MKFVILGVRCLAHLLQLAVGDFLESISSSYSNALTLTREAVKGCRMQNVKNALNKEASTFLSLDVPTRFVSLSINSLQ